MIAGPRAQSLSLNIHHSMVGGWVGGGEGVQLTAITTVRVSPGIRTYTPRYDMSPDGQTVV